MVVAPRVVDFAIIIIPFGYGIFGCGVRFQ
jgi:hypothetical protein